MEELVNNLDRKIAYNAKKEAELTATLQTYDEDKIECIKLQKKVEALEAVLEEEIQQTKVTWWQRHRTH